MKKGYREYRYIPGKVKFRRRMMALGVAVVLGVGSYALYKHVNNKALSSTKKLNIITEANAKDLDDNQNYEEITPVVTEVPTVEPTAEPTIEPVYEEPLVRYVNNGINKGDSVISTTDVNLRLGPTKDSFKLGQLPKGTTVDRIMSINGWDLVKYNGSIYFVSSDYTKDCEVDYNNDYYYIEEENDVVRTTTKLNFRTGPNADEPKIDLLPNNEELVVLGRAIPYADSEDVWYLVKHKDKIGFVKASYTKSLKEKLMQTDPDITDLTIIDMAYVERDTSLYNSNGEAYKTIKANQLVKIFVEYKDYYLIEYGDSIGLVHRTDLKKYQGTFVVVDLGDQKVYMYCNTDMVFEDVCTTGKNSTPTRTGAFRVSEVTNQRYFSEEAQATELWARFDGGNGLHDAEGWENIKNFGSPKYTKNSGSKGCVRLPYEVARFLKQYIRVGTKVLVKD